MKTSFFCLCLFLPFICLSGGDSLREPKMMRLSCAFITGNSYHAYSQNTGTSIWSNHGNDRREGASTFNGTLSSNKLFAFSLVFEKQCNKWLQYQVQTEFNTYSAKTPHVLHQTYNTLFYPKMIGTGYDSIRTTLVNSYAYRDEISQQFFIPSIGLGVFKSSEEWLVDLGVNVGVYVPMGGYIRRTYEGETSLMAVRTSLKSSVLAMTSFKLKVTYRFHPQHALYLSATNAFVPGAINTKQNSVMIHDALVFYSISGIQSTTFGLGYTFFLR